uniref:Uncharacterized protein n=1 Tax=Candidatus Methanogaster sp. ANME-2c ERB4 TaxID=2759911 RepID=A0A7G9YH62_9EURY|nr:hypothetical protein LNGCCOLK_00023 [Methanosarcinales archaeon ANME-2c ERB4]
MKIFEYLNRDECTTIMIMHGLGITSNAARIARVKGGLLVNENMNT